ncbi:MAG: RNA degradosome polyphosphate kinase, partial [Gemmatimonadales bacterium]
LGRFLEHARVFRFGNAGEDEWYIGSADWRPRNLRRRVEVLAPVDDDEARARLGRSMELEIQDPMGWELQSDGSYMRVTPVTGVDFKSAQETYIELAAGTAIPNDSAD